MMKNDCIKEDKSRKIIKPVFLIAEFAHGWGGDTIRGIREIFPEIQAELERINAESQETEIRISIMDLEGYPYWRERFILPEEWNTEQVNEKRFGNDLADAFRLLENELHLHVFEEFGFSHDRILSPSIIVLTSHWYISESESLKQQLYRLKDNHIFQRAKKHVILHETIAEDEELYSVFREFTGVDRCVLGVTGVWVFTQVLKELVICSVLAEDSLLNSCSNTDAENERMNTQITKNLISRLSSEYIDHLIICDDY